MSSARVHPGGFLQVRLRQVQVIFTKDSTKNNKIEVYFFEIVKSVRSEPSHQEKGSLK